MDFNKFQTEFLTQLKSKNKKCLESIESNKTLIQENLGENADAEVIKNFVKELNEVIVENVENDDHQINIIIEGNKNSTHFQNKYELVEKVLKNPYFSRVLENFKDSDVLLRACKEGNKSAAKWLLTMNVTPYLQDEDGVSALMYAAKNSFEFVVEAHLHDSVCINLVDNKGENVLFYSVRNLKFVIDNVMTNNKYQNNLVLNSDININQTNNKGETILTYCIKHDIIEPICRFFLYHPQIDVNIADNDGKTAAMYLTEKGLFVELDKLHDKNCNYDYIDMDGQSALSILISKMYDYNKEIDKVPYIDYAREMNIFVNYQCNFNYSVDNDENTAFMVILIQNDMTTAKFCAKYLKKLDLSVKNKYGENATSLCYKLGHYKLIPYLKSNPTFNYNYRDPINQNNLLMIATVNNYIGIKELLENDPTIINEVNNKNENGLIIAAKINQVKAVEMLLKRGIYVNHQDNLGNTALHYAVEIQEPYLVSQLMTKNPDIHIKNNEGKSPLDLAHEISEDNDNSKNIKKEILEILTNPSYKLKNIKFNSQSTNKYTEEIQKYIIPYANNYYPEYSSRSSMESDKKLIYKRNETKGMSTKFILFEVGEFLLRFGIIILVIYLLKFLF